MRRVCYLCGQTFPLTTWRKAIITFHILRESVSKQITLQSCSLVLTNLLRSIPMSWRVSRSLTGSLSGCRLLIFTGGRNLRKISRKTIVLLEGSRFSDFVICNCEYLLLLVTGSHQNIQVASAQRP